ncbi:MAG: phosphate ABC transporter ATP-binding protein [Ramlibacter sp.]|nr:phosphate ABC transporter ATP-binding protein [Ramlibacter sp.]
MLFRAPPEVRDQECCFEISNLDISYGARKVIENTSLRIPHNAVTAIMGPSGCGKSTFLCSLNRLTDLELDCRITGDVIFQKDCGSVKGSPVVLGRQIGMLFQKPNPFPFSIWRNLEFPLRQHGVTDKAVIAQAIEQALTDVGLWAEVKDKLKVSALSLSGGQQQRLCLARALVLKPSVLLMDEPCSALDPISTQKIEALIKELAKRITIVLVTHNIAQARRVADYIALFWHDGSAGRLIEHGRASEVFEAPSSDFARMYFAFE